MIFTLQKRTVRIILPLLLSLSPQPNLGLGLLHKIRLNFLEASQQFPFLQGRVVSPTSNPHPGGPGLCIYIPQRQGGPVIPLGTHFSRLLRHTWVTGVKSRNSCRNLFMRLEILPLPCEEIFTLMKL
jgi:hypothetical protein